MKSLFESIQENLSRSQKGLIGAHVMDHTLTDAFEWMKKNGWKRDESYDNWTSGESVIFKFTKGNDKLWLEADDKKELYHGDNLDDVMDKLKISDIQ